MKFTCDIPSRQNQPDELRLLAAASEAYGRAKIVMAFQLSLTVPVAFVSALVLAWNPDAKIWITSFSLMIALIDVLWLSRLQSSFKRKGAVLQQMLDCQLFRLPWNSFRCGPALEAEEVLRLSKSRFSDEKKMEQLRDWYPKEVGSVSLPLATLICQRSCLRWDGDLRRHFKTGLLIILTVLSFLVVLIALIMENNMKDMIQTVAVPLAPSIIWIIREAFAQEDAASKNEKFFQKVKSLWEKAMTESCTDEFLAMECAQIQDALFDSRSRNPLIFNKIYERLRCAHEEEMQFNANGMVAAAREKYSVTET